MIKNRWVQPGWCKCQGNDPWLHKHYADIAGHPCARCGSCKAFDPVDAPTKPPSVRGLSALPREEPQPAPSGEAPRTPAEVPAATFDPHIRHALSALERATKEMDAAFSDDTFRAFNRTWCALFAAIESYAQRRALSGLPQPTPEQIAALSAFIDYGATRGPHDGCLTAQQVEAAINWRSQFGPPSPPKER